MDTSEHELLICDLLAPARRDRYRQLLDKGTKKARGKFVDGLHHTLDVDDRFATRVPTTHGGACEAEEEWILAQLRRLGAPHACYVITDGDMDQQAMPLEESLRALHGGFRGALICCVPGRLAYYEGEDLGERYILWRPVASR